jgi:hypothetical protein
MAELHGTLNDSKWCRLLDAIADLRLPVSYWRFLHDNREFQIPTPQPDMVIEHEGSRGIGDFSAFGPFFFRDVETVRWPTTYSRDWCRGCEPVVERQSITDLSKALDGCGNFDYELNEDGLILHAYRPLGGGGDADDC